MPSFSFFSALKSGALPANVLGFSAAMALRNIAHAQRNIVEPEKGDPPAWVTPAIASKVCLADTLGELLYACGGDPRSLAGLVGGCDQDERLSAHWQALKAIDAGAFAERRDRFVSDPTLEQGMVLLSDVFAHTLNEIERSRRFVGACA